MIEIRMKSRIESSQVATVEASQETGKVVADPRKKLA